MKKMLRFETVPAIFSEAKTIEDRVLCETLWLTLDKSSLEGAEINRILRYHVSVYPEKMQLIESVARKFHKEVFLPSLIPDSAIEKWKKQ